MTIYIQRQFTNGDDHDDDVTMTTTTTIEIILTMIYTGTSPGVHSLNSVEGPGLKGGPGRVPRGPGEAHLDLEELLRRKRPCYN